MSDIFSQLKALPPQERQKILAAMPKAEAEEVYKILEELDVRELREETSKDFMKFVGEVWPDFIHGAHHARMARAFEEVANGTCKRLIINMPPRHTKSEFASYLLPAWFLGKFPNKKVIQTSHTAELAVGFGRKVRNLVDNEKYKRLFPTIELQSDSKAAGRWNTNFGGDYFAIGVGGAVTGKGADLLIIDDPHSEQEAALAAFNPEIYDKVYEWYTSGPRQRLQPGGLRVIRRLSLKENGGRYGSMTIPRSASSRYRLGIRRMKRRRSTTLALAPLGVFGTTRKTTTHRTSSSLMLLKSVWSFRNSRKKRTSITWNMNRMLFSLKRKRREHRLSKN
jgi:hypothetical protein